MCQFLIYSQNELSGINCNSITDNVNIDCIGLVDLTIAFGDEVPSLEWCRNNIDYFDSSTTIYV